MTYPPPGTGEVDPCRPRRRPILMPYSKGECLWCERDLSDAPTFDSDRVDVIDTTGALKTFNVHENDVDFVIDALNQGR